MSKATERRAMRSPDVRAVMLSAERELSSGEVTPSIQRLIDALLKDMTTEQRQTRIAGKFPTGPECYEGEPKPRKDDGQSSQRRIPLGTPIKAPLSDEGRERQRESGRNRWANLKAKRSGDLAELAKDIITGKESCE